MILSPIGRLYAGVMAARNALFDRDILSSSSLGARTISVGNLTTGGTGKTPLTALISVMLIDICLGSVILPFAFRYVMA